MFVNKKNIEAKYFDVGYLLRITEKTILYFWLNKKKMVWVNTKLKNRIVLYYFSTLIFIQKILLR